MRRIALLTAAWLVASVGWSFHREDRDRVAALASQLVQATDRLDRNAAAARHRFDPREDRYLKEMHSLDSAARWLALQLDRYPDDPERSRDDFRWLTRVHAEAEQAFDTTAPAVVRRDLQTVNTLMNRLRNLYEGRRSEPPARGDDRWDVREVTVPAGSTLTVSLDQAIRSRDLRAGDTIPVTVAENVIGGRRVALAAGTPATVRVVEMDRAGRVKGRELISFELTQIERDGRTVPVDSNVVTFVADDSTGRDTAVIGGSTALGLILGAITDGGDGAVKGAATGAAAGTGVVLLTRGETVRLAAGHRIDFLLDEDLRLAAPRGLDDRRGGGLSRR